MLFLKKYCFLLLVLALACDTGNLTVLADLPGKLKEASGIETVKDSNLIWMLNDGGNSAEIYGLDLDGDIKEALEINAKNNDWEDLASDSNGNLYIGDFGNNANKRKNLAILKVKHEDLDKKSPISIERISFRFPDQTKYPPKKKSMGFDCESFFFLNDSLYLFTKNRVRGAFGKTKLYKIPAKRGQHTATYIGSYSLCDDLECWITSADISDDGKKVVLLNHKSALVFTNFPEDRFFDGVVKEYLFEHESQKEAVCFKTDNELYITDEKSQGAGGNLYLIKID